MAEKSSKPVAAGGGKHPDDPAQLDALIKATGDSAPLAHAYKTLRLYQLLVPGL